MERVFLRERKAEALSWVGCGCHWVPVVRNGRSRASPTANKNSSDTPLLMKHSAMHEGIPRLILGNKIRCYGERRGEDAKRQRDVRI